MLGMSTSLKRTGVYSDVTSSCIRGNMKDNITFDDDEWDKAPEVDVTFYGDTATSDNKKVLIYNVGNYAPLAQLGYIKFVSMFFGLEELGEKLYDEISANYRCAAAQVQQAIMAGTYPTGALISPIRKDGDKFTVFQSAWWNSILSDAGSALVNVSADGQASDTGNPTKPGLVTIDANSAGNNFARNSWAIIDTTQYDQLPGKQAPKTLPESTRITADTYTSRSGASSASYAVKNNNVWLTDKAANRNRRHSELHVNCFGYPPVSLLTVSLSPFPQTFLTAAARARIRSSVTSSPLYRLRSCPTTQTCLSAASPSQTTRLPSGDSPTRAPKRARSWRR